jgi:predicted alpha/beta-hydrolase family hydrolase
MTLAPVIKLTWLSDGDHDFGPRGASGFTRSGNIATAAVAVATFVAGLHPLR